MLSVLGIPLFAVLLALLMFASFRMTRTRLALITSVLWIFYAAYEFLVQIRVLCAGDCSIRADLLLIYPILLIYTLASAFRTGKVLLQRRRMR